MASTGQLYDGKSHAYWTDAEGTILLEHFGTLDLPATTPNETNEHPSDVANRKEITVKTGFENPTISILANTDLYFRMLKCKTKGTLGTLSYLLGGNATDGKQSDGGFLSMIFTAKVANVNGPSGDVEGSYESFDTEFGIIGLIGTGGAMGTLTYDTDIVNPAAPTGSLSTGTGA